eukprot:jgi/Tetstr1/457655/TSEL_004236.t1
MRTHLPAATSGYQRLGALLCTHVNHWMESDDPAVAAMHLAYAATFDPSVYMLTAVQELRCARQALVTADLGMVSDAAAALSVLEALHPPLAPTDPEYSPPDGTVFALHKDDPATREERAKTGEPLEVRPLGIGSVLVHLASAHALVQVGADAREAIGPQVIACGGGEDSIRCCDWVAGVLQVSVYALDAEEP